MAKRIQLVGYLDAAELFERYRAAADRVARSQLQIIWLLTSGKSLAEVAAASGYATRWIQKLIHRYQRRRRGGLGRPAPQQCRRAPAVERGPACRVSGGACGRAAGRWLVERAQGCAMDRRKDRARSHSPASRLGLSQAPGYEPAGAAGAPRAGGEPGRPGGV